MGRPLGRRGVTERRAGPAKPAVPGVRAIGAAKGWGASAVGAASPARLISTLATFRALPRCAVLAAILALATAAPGAAASPPASLAAPRAAASPPASLAAPPGAAAPRAAASPLARADTPGARSAPPAAGTGGPASPARPPASTTPTAPAASTTAASRAGAAGAPTRATAPATVPATAAPASAPVSSPRPSTGSGVALGTPGPSSLRLVDQSTWVDQVHNVFTLRLLATTALPPDRVDVAVDVYGALASRSDFTQSLTRPAPADLVARPIRAPLSTFPTDASGAIEIKIPLTDQRPIAGLVYLPVTGVYPLSVELRPHQGGQPLARLTTHMLYQAAPISGPRLNVAWVVPVHAPPGVPGEPDTVSAADDAKIRVLVDALRAHPAVPLSVQPTPDTLAALDAGDPTIVNVLGSSLGGREVLAGTWVPASVPAMLAAGLGADVPLSLARATGTLQSDLGRQVAARTWVQDGPIDNETMGFLRGAHFDRVVLPEADVGGAPRGATTLQPFEVKAPGASSGTDPAPFRAAVADAGLAAHFMDTTDRVLAAHQLLAELAQISEDAPLTERGVVIVTPRLWVPDAAFLNVWLHGLETSPLLAGTSIDSLFDAVPPARAQGAVPRAASGSALPAGQPDAPNETRQLVTDEGAIRSAATALLGDGQRTARRQLDAFALTLPDDTTGYAQLERLVLQAPSSDSSVVERQSRLDRLDFAVRAATSVVQLAGARTVTLTERKGQLPVTIVSQSDQPVRVSVRMQSNKLKFAGGGPTGQVTFPPMTLHKGNNALGLTVEARTPGASPLLVTVFSPDGYLVIRQVNWTVRSTALSGVGVVLSVGAALFLMGWWGQSAWRSRATRRRGRRRGRHPARPTGDEGAGGATVAAGPTAAGARATPEPLGAGRRAGP